MYAKCGCVSECEIFSFSLAFPLVICAQAPRRIQAKIFMNCVEIQLEISRLNNSKCWVLLALKEPKLYVLFDFGN